MMCSTTLSAAVTTVSGETSRMRPTMAYEAHHVEDIVLLVTESVAEQARGFHDEVAVHRFQLGPFGVAMRLAKLVALRRPTMC